MAARSADTSRWHQPLSLRRSAGVTFHSTQPRARTGAVPVTGVRAATAADLAAVIAVFEACWTVSYRDVLPDEVIATMPTAEIEALWRRVFASAAGDELLVAEHDGAVVGVARWAVTAPGVGWLHSLYVDPRCQGAGVGRALLAAVEQHLAAAGATTAHLWAFAANQHGRRFYAAQGWAIDGETRVEERFGEPEVRFTKRLIEVAA